MSEPPEGTRGRSLSVRASLLLFVAMTGAAVAATMGLLVLLDPRTQDFWAERWAAFVALLGTLIPR